MTTITSSSTWTPPSTWIVPITLNLLVPSNSHHFGSFNMPNFVSVLFLHLNTCLTVLFACHYFLIKNLPSRKRWLFTPVGGTWPHLHEHQWLSSWCQSIDINVWKQNTTNFLLHPFKKWWPEFDRDVDFMLNLTCFILFQGKVLSYWTSLSSWNVTKNIKSFIKLWHGQQHTSYIQNILFILNKTYFYIMNEKYFLNILANWKKEHFAMSSDIQYRWFQSYHALFLNSKLLVNKHTLGTNHIIEKLKCTTMKKTLQLAAPKLNLSWWF